MQRRKAFTLIEMLVVVGIIVVLLGLVAPMIYKAYKSSTVARVKSDLAAISTALEAYKQDFGDYPRTDPAAPDSGAAILGKALVGPGDRMRVTGTDPNYTLVDPKPDAYSTSKAYKAGDIVISGATSAVATGTEKLNTNIFACIRDCTNQTPPTAPVRSNTYWVNVSPFDGADGPGFRVRPEIGGVAQGKPQGPYLNVGRITMRGTTFIDANGGAILYFPLSLSKSDFAVADNGTVAGGYLTLKPAANPRYAASSFINIRDGITFFMREGETDYTNAGMRIAAMLGDVGDTTSNSDIGGSNLAPDGAITQGATSKENGIPNTTKYLLWSAGPDALFGPTNVSGAKIYDVLKEIEKGDDVTNFR